MKLSGLKEFLTTKLRNRYRLIIRNDRNLAERVSIVLTPMNVLLMFSSLLVVFSAIAIFVFPLTPLRYIMPGGGEVSPRDFKVLQEKIDSLEYLMHLRDQRDSNLYRILRGDTSESDAVSYQSFPQNPASGWWWVQTANAAGEAEPNQTSAPKPAERKQKLNYAFIAPMKGVVTDSFDASVNHPAVDVVSYTNAGVKATMDGTVVLSHWTPETGHVILLQHRDNFLSVYKHNSVLFKKPGNRVRAGEVIALMGNSGERTTGPHLHLELWHNGEAVDPIDYMKF